ncbi:hypothetical protein SDC9_133184 [bioreactor metagenome]|uniref:Uncharacterized protein n=1 Tax=bioreactor metagenome TaxID=1076179 RepID=A0A645D9Z4_9ZZZZ
MIKPDNAHLRRDHHGEQHQRKQYFFAAKPVFCKAKRGQRTKVAGKRRIGHRDQQAVGKPAPDIDVRLHGGIVVRNAFAGQQVQPRDDIKAGMGGVDDDEIKRHDRKRQQ